MVYDVLGVHTSEDLLRGHTSTSTQSIRTHSDQCAFYLLSVHILYAYHTDTHRHTHTHTHTQTDTRRHTKTQAHTHMHTHTRSPKMIYRSVLLKIYYRYVLRIEYRICCLLLALLLALLQVDLRHNEGMMPCFCGLTIAYTATFTELICRVESPATFTELKACDTHTHTHTHTHVF